MSRSGYVEADDCDDHANLRIAGWQANVRRMMRGKAGQAFLWELYLALEALPEKALITGGLINNDGTCCALGALALARKIEIPEEMKIVRSVDGEPDDEPDDMYFYEEVAPLLNIKTMMAQEVMYANDELDTWHWPDGRVCHSVPWHLRDTPIRTYDTPQERWQRMRRWVVSRLKGIP